MITKCTLKPKHKDAHFDTQRLFEKWLKATHTVKIELEDLGQDMQQIWIDERGEILHSDFNADVYIGRFVQLNSITIGEPLYISSAGFYQPYGKLVPFQIINRK